MIDKIPTHSSDSLAEDVFWDIIKQANWPHEDSNIVKIRYLKSMNVEFLKKFRAKLNDAYDLLEDKICNKTWRDYDEDIDLVHHIIGLGKKTFYACLNNVNLIQKIANKGILTDSLCDTSFSYCIPYESDYAQYNIKHIEKIAKESVKEIKRFLKMDNRKEIKFLKPIEKELSSILSVMNDFLKSNENEEVRLQNLISNKDMTRNMGNKIDKFFDENEMELPRKFEDDNGNNGICIHIFNNTINDAEDLLLYKKLDIN